MGAALPILSVLGTVFAVNQANQRANQAMSLAQQQMRREEELSKPTAEQAAKYNQLVNQLSYIAGIDPTNMFVTSGLRGGETLAPPEAIQGRFDPISSDVMDAVISSAQSDILEALGKSQEQVLQNLARRGLAGSSLVDERQAFLEREANRNLADIRTRAELENERLRSQFAQQALGMLSGLDPMQNLSAGTLGYQSLLGQIQDSQKGFEDLIAGLVAFGLDSLQSQGAGDPLSNLWASLFGGTSGKALETEMDRELQTGMGGLGGLSTLFTDR